MFDCSLHFISSSSCWCLSSLTLIRLAVHSCRCWICLSDPLCLQFLFLCLEIVGFQSFILSTCFVCQAYVFRSRFLLQFFMLCAHSVPRLPRCFIVRLLAWWRLLDCTWTHLYLFTWCPVARQPFSWLPPNRVCGCDSHRTHLSKNCPSFDTELL